MEWPWYQPDCDEAASRQQLTNAQPGEFIVRKSSQPDKLGLNVRMSDRKPAGKRINKYLISTRQGAGGAVEYQYLGSAWLVDLSQLMQHVS
jgi:hypothetical protein